MHTPLEEYKRLSRTTLSTRIALVQRRASLLLKREDLNPSGSHKDRALNPFLSNLIRAGEKEFCLSSSGNLAIAAAHLAQTDPSISFHLFLPNSLDARKRTRLAHTLGLPFSPQSPLFSMVNSIDTAGNITYYFSRIPKTDAVKFSKEKKIRLLRSSTDEEMLEGYHQLAQELIDQAAHRPIGSIFIAASSGTALVGLWEGFKKLQMTNDKLQTPQLHIVQSTKVHPMASNFDNDFTATDVSIAAAIVDRVAHRKPQVIEAVQASGGSGWVASDQEIEEARLHLIHTTNIEDVSPESAMSLAGLQKALRKGFSVKTPVVLVLTGQ